MTGRPTVFISYHHQDTQWKELLAQHLKVLEKQDLLEIWDDQRIAAGANWKNEIENAINHSRIAVLLVSADFLASDFVLNEEVPRLLMRRRMAGVTVIPIIVRPCVWQAVPWLAEMRVRPLNGRALSADSGYFADAELADASQEILSKLAVDAQANASSGTMRLPAAGPIAHSPIPDSSHQAVESMLLKLKRRRIGIALASALALFGLARGCGAILGSTHSVESAGGNVDEDMDVRMAKLLSEAERLRREDYPDPVTSASVTPIVPAPVISFSVQAAPHMDDDVEPALIVPSTGPTSKIQAPDMQAVPDAGEEPLLGDPPWLAELDSDLFAPELAYRGIIQDSKTKILVRGARVTLLGTPCEAWTDGTGMFDFAQCDAVSVSRLREPKVLVELPNGSRCSDIHIQQPPAVTRIKINWQSCAVTFIGDAGL
ncbi:toll/interleukin-1 receptor domain-containing protein [Sorangium sp. So ce1182]|uniref:toll/interleukin-1 receptor domain-containing protein n=1 Tax=Sorangium sp. So ce1182 TaxID=3133334 RepID=UPI003F608BFF